MRGDEKTIADEDPLTLVGEITGAFGIRGEVKMRPLLEHPEALPDLADGVLLRFPNGQEEKRRIRGVRRGQQGVALLTLEACGDRNAAEALHNVLLFIRQSELPPLEPDAFYATQLVGLQVVTESGRDLGTVTQVHFYPANDVYETPVALIPAVADVVIEVNLPEGRLLVRDVPGLRKDE